MPEHPLPFELPQRVLGDENMIATFAALTEDYKAAHDDQAPESVDALLAWDAARKRGEG